MSAMTKHQRANAFADLEKDLPRLFPDVPVPTLDSVRVVARKIAARHHDRKSFEGLTADPTKDGKNPVLTVLDEDNNCVGLVNLDGGEGDDEVADAMIHALRYLRVPARRKATKLVNCGGCCCYHPADFDGDCRDDGNRFAPPNDPDDEATHFDDGDEGGDYEPDLTNCKHCGCYIDLGLSGFEPAKFSDRSGMKDDPRAPGDQDDVCADCNYGKDLSGGNDTTPTYKGDHSEWEGQDD